MKLEMKQWISHNAYIMSPQIPMYVYIFYIALRKSNEVNTANWKNCVQK